MSKSARAHDILQDFSSVEKSLNKKPTKQEYFGAPGLSPHGKFSQQVIEQVFGGWTQLIRAAGMAGYSKGKRDKQEIKKRDYEARNVE